MKVINRSRKIIGINGMPLLPGAGMELEDGTERHPAIADYLRKGILADANAVAADNGGISDFEKVRIAEEAINKYKKEQEALAAAQAEKEAEIKAVQSMKKKELLLKAAGMALEVKDNDTEDTLKEKIVAAIRQ